MSLFRLYWKNQLASPLFYLIGVVLFFENLHAGLGHWKYQHLSSAGIHNYSIEWSLWSGSFSGWFFLLLWGIWVFIQVEKPRRDGLLPLLYSKPLPYFRAVNCHLAALILGGVILNLLALWGSNLVLMVQFDQYRPGILWFLLPPIVSQAVGIAFFTLNMYLLSVVFADWRVFVPLYFVSSLMLFSFIGINLNYRKLTNFLNPLMDSYLISNRFLIICASVVLWWVIRWAVKRQERGEIYSWFLQGKECEETVQPLRIKSAVFARILYSWKIYFNSRILFACVPGLLLGGQYALRIFQRGFEQPNFILIMVSQTLLTLLGLMVTLPLANVEMRHQVDSLIQILPKGGVRVLLDKMVALVMYFTLLVGSFLLPFVFVPGALVTVHQYLLALFPPFIFFVGIGYLAIRISQQAHWGYLFSGGLWIIFISLERRVPYWIQPFFELAEYRPINVAQYLLNKQIITGLGLAFLILTFYLEYRRLKQPSILERGSLCK